MRLPDGPRQIIAALLAGAAFCGLYFGLLLQWYVALGLATAVYVALLLIIVRRTPLDEIVLSDRVSAADIANAGALLANAAARITNAAGTLPPPEAAPLADMAAHLSSIRTQILADPADYRPAHRFITFYMPRMVDNIDTYAQLSQRATGPARERLAGLAAGLQSYGQVVAKIDQACMENDFSALEAEVEALAFQLKRA
jgi:5-bromo-4-chloroindolyl phosphate hydrolysis protein